jgi:hypothetical protein
MCIDDDADVFRVYIILFQAAYFKFQVRGVAGVDDNAGAAGNDIGIAVQHSLLGVKI